MQHVKDFKTTISTAQALCLSVLLGLAIFTVPVATAQECLSMLPDAVFDTSTDCSSVPDIDRVLGSQTISWGGRQYLFVNKGNEIGIWNVDDPLNPIPVTTSSFNVPNLGDSDYDLMAFSVCDDCRYGAAWYKMGTLLFDLGDLTQPGFRFFNFTLGAISTFGGITFPTGANQYLLTTSGVSGSCNGTATLFQMSGVNPATGLTNIGCISTDTRPILAAGGHSVDGYLYVGDSSTRVYLFEVEDLGGTIALTYLSEPMRASFGKDRGLDFDRAAGIAVEANSSGAAIWDVSNPGNPVKRGTITGYYSRASVSYPLVFLSLGGVKNTEKTFDISDLDSPLPVDQAFWNSDNSWNYPDHNCTFTQAGSFSPDGSALYLMRYSRLEVVDSTLCTALFFDSFESGDDSAWSGSAR